MAGQTAREFEFFGEKVKVSSSAERSIRFLAHMTVWIRAACYIRCSNKIYENRRGATSTTVFGLTIWDCSLVLKNYLERKYKAEDFRGQRILELG